MESQGPGGELTSLSRRTRMEAKVSAKIHLYNHCHFPENPLNEIGIQCFICTSDSYGVLRLCHKPVSSPALAGRHRENTGVHTCRARGLHSHLSIKKQLLNQHL